MRLLYLIVLSFKIKSGNLYNLQIDISFLLVKFPKLSEAIAILSKMYKNVFNISNYIFFSSILCFT